MRGDECWRKLTCLDHHHETQPMPGPLSWFFHHLPPPLHRVEVAANHVTQLVVPLPAVHAATRRDGRRGTDDPDPAVAGAVGNFSWLNWITIVLALSVVPAPGRSAVVSAAPLWYEVVVLAVAALLVFLSHRPVRQYALPPPGDEPPFDSLHLVNTYGAFGTVSRVPLRGGDRGHRRRGGPGGRGTGGSTSSRASPVIRGAGRVSSRRIICGWTG
ncbi:lipase maturation factor family protein [Streptomyces thinghirensis]|nr:lipase maturation factor family protein [Streptomyces thinghirensis]